MNAPLNPFTIAPAWSGDDISISAKLARDWVGITDAMSDSHIWTQMVDSRRERDRMWLTADEAFEQAYVCAMLDLEAATGRYFERRDDVEAAIDFIEEARRSRPHYGATPYRPPTYDQTRHWRPRHERCEIVASGRVYDFVLSDLSHRGALLYCIGENWLWHRVSHEVHVACARAAKSIDPELDYGSRHADIRRAIDRATSERSLRRLSLDLTYVAEHL
jgi:hypothetical protein